MPVPDDTPRLGPPALVLGKFLPPHNGHLHLFHVAGACTDNLHIVVEHIAGESIPSARRAAWVAELVPSATVHHLARAMPQTPSLTPAFWDIWRDALLALLPEAPDRVFASESYGAPLAACLGARFVPVDIARAAVPISATRVRADPQACFGYLPPPVRAWYATRVAVVGPSQSGKSALASFLAQSFGATLVPDCRASVLETPGSAAVPWPVRIDDMAQLQRAQEASLARLCAGLLVCDGDLASVQALADKREVAEPAWLAGQAAAARYALTLWCGDRENIAHEVALCRWLSMDRTVVRLPHEGERRRAAARDAVLRLR